MTIKAKRAKALRKMDYDEAASYIMGGVVDMGALVDETFPAEPVRKALAVAADKINLPEFEVFFGRNRGRHRSVVESTQEQPSVAEELALVGEAMESGKLHRVR